MKPDDLRAMTLDQLEDEALKLKKEQFNLRFQRATNQLENTARVRVVRRDIARIKTIAALKRSGQPAAAPKAAAARAPPAGPLSSRRTGKRAAVCGVASAPEEINNSSAPPKPARASRSSRSRR